MKKLLIATIISVLFVNCGEGTKVRLLSASINGQSNPSLSSRQNNTYIPKSGIYNESDSEEVKFIKVINYARSIARVCKNTDGRYHEASKGFFKAAAPLQFNQDLYAAALEHSIDLAKSGTFSHYGSGTSSDITGSNLGHKSSFNERIEANGYVNYSTIAENIGAGQKSIEEIVHSWLESPGHCANLMNPKLKEVGVAKYVEPNSQYKIYWTSDFGARR